VFTNRNRESISIFVCAVSLYVAETPKASVKDHETPLPIIPLDSVAYGFVGQPFSKQLYIDTQFTVTEWLRDPLSVSKGKQEYLKSTDRLLRGKVTTTQATKVT